MLHWFVIASIKKQKQTKPHKLGSLKKKKKKKQLTLTQECIIYMIRSCSLWELQVTPAPHLMAFLQLPAVQSTTTLWLSSFGCHWRYQHPTAALWIQLASGAPGKAAADSPCTWDPVTHMGDQDGVAGFCPQPGQRLKSFEDWINRCDISVFCSPSFHFSNK